MDLPAVRASPFLHGMESPPQTACWPMAVVAGLWPERGEPMLSRDRYQDGQRNNGTGKVKT